jgi:hypothetical protein
VKTTLLAAASLLLTVLPAPSAGAAPSIAFLNPSGYSTSPPVISDVPDRDGLVHLVAWARDAPNQALVEFEFQPQGQNPATFTAERVGDDTWETFVPIPDAHPDGSGYTLTARLYQGVPGDADEIANAQMAVEVNQSEVPPPNGATVELTYPDNGGGLGVFVPKGKRPVAVLDYAASVDTEQVRAFYSSSAPGTAPVWEPSCGSSVPDEEGFGRVRCTIDASQARAVSAVALVANKTAPPALPNPALDDAGDAHRVVPYLQEPRSLDLVAGGQTVAVSACHVMTAFVGDQVGRIVAGANVDVHAEGPEDELHFAAQSGETDPFQAPDGAHAAREDAKRCSDNANLNRQGDHNTPGGDDVKHVESVEGTSDTGGFRFALRSDFAGGTFIRAWVDVDDDDLPQLSEASGGTQLGWGSPPPPPPVDVFLQPSSATATVGSCVAFEIVARRGGGPFGNANVDVHLQGPDPAVAFCQTDGGSAARPPESGDHVGDAHEDGARHAEGETDVSGRFGFGVTSGVPGTTRVQVWIDAADDDLATSDRSRTGSVTWGLPGERSISLRSDEASVARGRRVRLFGDIEGDPSCSGAQLVNIQSRPVRRGAFGTVKSVRTEPGGRFSTRVKMTSSRKFRAVAPPNEPCERAASRIVTVRVG